MAAGGNCRPFVVGQTITGRKGSRCCATMPPYFCMTEAVAGAHAGLPIWTIRFIRSGISYSSGFQAVDEWGCAGDTRRTGFAAAARRLFEQGRRGRIFFDEALPLIGLKPAPGLVAQLVDVYRAHEPKLALFPDAAEVLSWAAPAFQPGPAHGRLCRGAGAQDPRPEAGGAYSVSDHHG